MALDIQKLLADLEFTPEDIAALAPKFTPAAITKLEAGYMNRSQYDEFRTRLEETDAQLSREMQEWGAIQNKTTADAKAQAEEIERLRMEKVQLESRITTIATQAGIDPKTVLPAPSTVVPAKVDPVPAFDPSKFIDRTELGSMIPVLLNNPVELAAIQADHQALFGKPLTGDELRAMHRSYVTRAAKKENVDPRGIWEETFSVSARREQVAKDKYDTAIQEAEARGAERVRTEAALPTAHPTGSHSPVFKTGENQSQHASVLQRPQPGRATLGFAAALREGKYRPQPAGAGR